MDFDFRKPKHILALFLMAISFFLLIVYAAIAYFQPFPTSNGIGSNYSGVIKTIIEVYVLLFSLLFVVILMVVIPIIWYILVNNLRLRETFQRLGLRREGLGNALLWGFIAAVTAFVISVALDLVILQFGVDVTKMSNIPQLEQLFSIPTLVVLITVQPIAEEIFFRGFLLEKISALSRPWVGVVSSAVLFGIAHLSYGMFYTAVMATMLGLVFAVVVIRTKNLYSSILAHILVNVTSITLFFFGKSIGI